MPKDLWYKFTPWKIVERKINSKLLQLGYIVALWDVSRIRAPRNYDWLKN